MITDVMALGGTRADDERPGPPSDQIAKLSTVILLGLCPHVHAAADPRRSDGAAAAEISALSIKARVVATSSRQDRAKRARRLQKPVELRDRHVRRYVATSQHGRAPPPCIVAMRQNGSPQEPETSDRERPVRDGRTSFSSPREKPGAAAFDHV